MAKNYIMIKVNEPIGIILEKPKIQDDIVIALFIVHANNQYKNALVCGDKQKTKPPFIVEKPWNTETRRIETQDYGGVIASEIKTTIEMKEMKMIIKFGLLSTDRLNSGNRHKARQWDLIAYYKSQKETDWKKLTSLPIQICKEITGPNRDPH